jgi:TonB-dependent receptor
MQKNSANVSDGISAETIKRTPDKNTSDVLKRISGASIQDNRFVIVRGLNDRYNAALLNGAPLPSSEPDRKAFSFDIFPSNMIDNLVITKTASPDLPGDFAGGVIQINTKSVPEKDFQSITVGTGYNTITTFKNQRTYKGGATDWLGFDDGTRALPSYFPNTQYFDSPDTPYQDIVALAQRYKTDWAIKDKTFLPNTSFQYSIGKHYEFGDKVLGLLVSISHNRTNNYNETDRYGYAVPAEPAITKYRDNNYSVQVLTGSLVNLSLKFNENHSISFKNIFSVNSTDLVVERNGLKDTTDNPTRTTVADVRWFTSNKIYSGQFNGDHYFPKPKIKLTWSGFYSNINREIPNLRRNIYTIENPNSSDPLQTIPIANISTTNSGGNDYGGGMFFSENKETIEGAKIDISKKFAIGEEFINEIKIGAFVQKRDRDFFARQLQYKTLNFGGVFDNNLLNLPNETIFSPENMGQVAPGLNGFTLTDPTKVTDAYKAGSKLYAGYAMLDNRYKKFRLVWGARIENYIQTLDSRKTVTENLTLNNHQTDFLPSVNLIFSINKKQNLRLSYSRTLNRPEFRELAPFAFYDFTNQFLTQGNDSLKIAKVKNFDLRYEIYPGKGQLFSVSYFRKNFTDPVEINQLENKILKYQNAKSAIVSGLEFEFRTLLSTIFTTDNSTLLDDLTLYSNIAIIKSISDVSNFSNDIEAEKSRPMQGQSPYVFNAGLQYLNKDNGWSGALNVNRVGSRIAFASITERRPAIWEKPRTLLDLQVAKSFYKNKIELKLNIQNILAQDQIFYQNNYTEDVPQSSTITNLSNLLFTGDPLNEDGYDSKTDDLIWRTKFGRVFSLSMTYNF